MRMLLVLPLVGFLAVTAQHGVAFLDWGLLPRPGASAEEVLDAGDVIVIDGDTIHVRGRTIRLVGFDTRDL